MSKKITQLNAVTTPVETDILAAVNNTETKKITIGQLLTVPHSANLVYETIVIPATQMKLDSSDLPDFDYTNIGLAFDPDTDETVGIFLEMPHSWAEGTNITPKVRWIQSAAGVVVWQIEYKWTNRGELGASGFTTLGASSTQYTWSSGDLHNITAFSAISGTGKTVGSTLQIILTRLGTDGSDTYTPDALITQLDIVTQRDGMGTRQEYIK